MTVYVTVPQVSGTRMKIRPESHVRGVEAACLAVPEKCADCVTYDQRYMYALMVSFNNPSRTRLISVKYPLQHFVLQQAVA